MCSQPHSQHVPVMTLHRPRTISIICTHSAAGNATGHFTIEYNICCRHILGLTDLFNSLATSCWQVLFRFVVQQTSTSHGYHQHCNRSFFLADYLGDNLYILWLYNRCCTVQIILPSPRQISWPLLGTHLSSPCILLHSQTGSTCMVLAAAREIR
jgi:hypothetical protein